MRLCSEEARTSTKGISGQTALILSALILCSCTPKMPHNSPALQEPSFSAAKPTGEKEGIQKLSNGDVRATGLLRIWNGSPPDLRMQIGSTTFGINNDPVVQIPDALQTLFEEPSTWGVWATYDLMPIQVDARVSDAIAPITICRIKGYSDVWQAVFGANNQISWNRISE